MSSQTPTVSCPATTYNTLCPVLMGCELSFAELWLGVWQWRKTGCRGRRSGGVGDQLEVSEWTLPGPSVGEVTDEGVGASCQPPFAWEEKKRMVGWGRYSVQLGQRLRARYIYAAWSATASSLKPKSLLALKRNEPLVRLIVSQQSDTKTKFKSCFQLSRDGAKHSLKHHFHVTKSTLKLQQILSWITHVKGINSQTSFRLIMTLTPGINIEESHGGRYMTRNRPGKEHSDNNSIFKVVRL